MDSPGAGNDHGVGRRHSSSSDDAGESLIRRCSQCHKRIRVKPRHANVAVKCPACGAVIVPAAPEVDSASHVAAARPSTKPDAAKSPAAPVGGITLSDSDRRDRKFTLAGWAVSLGLHLLLFLSFTTITLRTQAGKASREAEEGLEIDMVEMLPESTAEPVEPEPTENGAAETMWDTPVEMAGILAPPLPEIEDTPLSASIPEAATASMTDPIIGLGAGDSDIEIESRDWRSYSSNSVKARGLTQFRPGGICGFRTEAGRQAALYLGATPQSEAAVEAGLMWLARAQEQDGRWDAKKWGGGSPYYVGSNGLAVLAFLGAGYHPGQAKYQATVRRGLDWLVRRMRPNGDLQASHVYGQGIAAMALCEAYGMSGGVRYRLPAQLAINHVVRLQGPTGGWGYDKERNDTSVSGWQIMALKSAKLAELNVPDSAIERAKGFLAAVTLPNSTSAYRLVERMEGAGTITMTPVGLLCRLFLDYGLEDEHVVKGAGLLRQWGPFYGELFNVYYIYHGTYAMFQMGGDYWQEWNAKFRDRLIDKQIKAEGPLQGSWTPEEHFDVTGGRVYCTAACVFALEVYYRYLPVNQ